MTEVEEAAVNVSESLKKLPPKKEEEGDFSKIISTGSTLLDLAITGTRIRGGGVPSGILIEIYGPPGQGKTTVMSEMGASAQTRGGYFLIGDAEQRIDPEYARIMGVKITSNNYRRVNTVKDVEELILSSPVTGKNKIDVIGVDSVAVLLSELDGSKEGDKRGAARAKEFHVLCRKTKSLISEKNRVVVFTNQIQDSQDPNPFAPKERTPGGNAIPFLASLRIRIGASPKGKLKKVKKIRGKDFTKVFGITSRCTIVKSTVDEPYRECDVPIVFNYGIDDIRGNLVFTHDILGEYSIGGETIHSTIEGAIEGVEKEGIESLLKEQTIELWMDLEESLRTVRKPKTRQ